MLKILMSGKELNSNSKIIAEIASAHNGSTKILDRETGNITYGEVPSGSVVVSGSLPSKNGVNLYCAVIVKKVDSQTRSKTSINELLRD